MGLLSRFRRKPKPSSERVVVVSEGLQAHGQRELAFAVRLREGEDEAQVRAQLGQVIEAVRSFAAQGQLVHPGGVTEFGSAGFLDSVTKGLIYADAHGLDPEIPDTALLAVLADESELRVAQASCGARVLARLGSVTSEYPFPVTSDRDRARVAQRGDGQSVLSQIARVPMHTMSVTLRGELVTLRCRSAAAQMVERALVELPDDVAFAFITAPEHTARGRLVWFPGQRGPAAITPPGSSGESLTGTMLMVAAGVEDEQLSLQEDGFALLARASTWARLREALINQEAFELPGGPGFGLRVVWEEDGWHTYEPDGGARGNERITLLTPEAELAQAVSVEALGSYAKQLIDGLQGLEGVALRVVLEPGALPVLAHRGSIPAAVLESLAAIEAPAVRGQAAFEIEKP